MSYTLQKSIDLLKKINRIYINGQPVYDIFKYHDYSLWSFFQTHIWVDLKQAGQHTISTGQPAWRDYILKYLVILISFTSFLSFWIKRPKVLIYANDIVVGKYKTDPRIQELYTFLKKEKISFGEIIHAPLSKKFLVNFFKRGRPVIYFELSDFLRPWLDRNIRPIKILDQQINWSGFSEEDKKISEKILGTYSQKYRSSIFRIRFFKKIFNWLKPKAIWAIDDSRYYQPLLLAAHLIGIKNYVFQHGRFNPYVVGAISYGIPPEKCFVPDKFIVWNEYWRNKLIELSPSLALHREKIIVGGRASTQIQSSHVLTKEKDDILTILMPYEPVTDKEGIHQYIAGFLKCPRVQVLFKLRGDVSEDDQMRKVGLSKFISAPNFKIIKDLTPDQVAQIDLVAGTFSTMLYDIVPMFKPVGVLKTAMTELEDMVQDGLADWIDINTDICAQVQAIANTSQEVLIQRAKKFEVTHDIHQTLAQLYND